jgi:hypothetical protein
LQISRAEFYISIIGGQIGYLEVAISNIQRGFTIKPDINSAASLVCQQAYFPMMPA